MNEKITGIMINYFFVCKRKLWYFLHDISLEKENENVKIGNEIDKNSYKDNEKHITINNEISIDFLRDNELHEVKKSKSMKLASIWQIKYYLYYLKQSKIEDVTGIINYYSTKEKEKVILTDEDENKIKEIIKEINDLKKSNFIPEKPKKTSICKKCAYYDFCYL